MVPAVPEQPNILLVTTDQQHFRLMSCAGDPYVHTPALDELAASGTRFGLAYSANPVCVPCRYSMMTGHMPHVFDGLETNRKRPDAERPKMRDWIDSPAMGHLLRGAGYETAYGGKLHVEGPYSYTPVEEDTYGFRWICSDIREQLAEECAAYLRGSHDRPFFIWASFDNPHDICGFLRAESPARECDAEPVPLPENFAPTRHEAGWIRALREGSLGSEETLELGLNRRFALTARDWPEDTWRCYRGVYRMFMEQVDRQVGLIMDALRDSGHDRDTVVVFLSDHGEHDGAHGLTMKRTFYEESVHVPMVIVPPGGTAGGIDNEHLVSNGLDLLPTICDYAGIGKPPALPGRSLRPLVERRSPRWRDYVVSETVGGRMVRTERFKYMVLHCEGCSEEQLFDMKEDPLETTNLAGSAETGDVLRRHRETLARWVKAQGDAKGRLYLSTL